MTEQVTLYTIGCPNCIELEQRLVKKHISYETVTDRKTMIVLGMTEVPMLKIGDTMLDYLQATTWLDGQEG